MKAQIRIRKDKLREESLSSRIMEARISQVKKTARITTAEVIETAAKAEINSFLEV